MWRVKGERGVTNGQQDRLLNWRRLEPSHFDWLVNFM